MLLITDENPEITIRYFIIKHYSYKIKVLSLSDSIIFIRVTINWYINV